jgi:hypothetical protein
MTLDRNRGRELAAAFESRSAIPTRLEWRSRSLPIWSQDKDMELAGVTVYTTGELLEAIRDARGEVG